MESVWLASFNSFFLSLFSMNLSWGKLYFSLIVYEFSRTKKVYFDRKKLIHDFYIPLFCYYFKKKLVIKLLLKTHYTICVWSIWCASPWIYLSTILVNLFAATPLPILVYTKNLYYILNQKFIMFTIYLLVPKNISFCYFIYLGLYEWSALIFR